MKPNAQVIAGIQEAINLEAALALQYLLDSRNVKRYGLSLAHGLKRLAKQCQSFAKDLTSRALFLEASPAIAPAPARTHATVSAIIADAITAESSLADHYTQLTKLAYDAGDMSNFHFFQHLVKWHREGDGKYKGHLKWLEKQAWQLKEFGETDYEEVKA